MAIRSDEDCIRFMQNKMHWPHWPILPVKNRETKELGYLVCQDYLLNEVIEGTSDLYGKPATVLVGNMFSVDLPHDRRIFFDSFESLVSAGWAVD